MLQIKSDAFHVLKGFRWKWLGFFFLCIKIMIALLIAILSLWTLLSSGCSNYPCHLMIYLFSADYQKYVYNLINCLLVDTRKISEDSFNCKCFNLFRSLRTCEYSELFLEGFCSSLFCDVCSQTFLGIFLHSQCEIESQ